MSKAIFLTVIMALTLHVCLGQGAPAQDGHGNKASVSVQYYSSDRPFHVCTETKVGFGITATGVLTGGAGFVVYNSGRHAENHTSLQRQENTGAAMWLVGGVLVVMGSILAADGTLHDMHRHPHRIEISSVQGRGMGVAYCFR